MNAHFGFIDQFCARHLTMLFDLGMKYLWNILGISFFPKQYSENLNCSYSFASALNFTALASSSQESVYRNLYA